MTAASQSRPAALTGDLETLRNAQVILSAAIQHAPEEALEPAGAIKFSVCGCAWRRPRSNHWQSVESTRRVRLSEDP